MQLLTISMMAVLLLAGCTPKEQQSSAAELQQQKTVVSMEQQEVIADNLKVPWSIVKHGNIIYITERPGTIVKIENGELSRQSVELEKKLSAASEAGLLGFVLAP